MEFLQLGSTDHELYTKISNADYLVPDFISKEARNLFKMIFVINCEQRPTADEVKRNYLSIIYLKIKNI